MAAGRRSLSPLGVVVLLLVLVVVGIGLLYAYRAQSPASREISYTEALAQVQNGQVLTVVIDGDRARLTRTDGTLEQVALLDRGTMLTQAVTDRNRTADPAHLVGLRYEQQSLSFGLVLSVVLSLLPIVLLVGLVFLAASAFTRSRSPDRYEALTRAADLRDRGVLTEDEFQREKRRILR